MRLLLLSVVLLHLASAFLTWPLDRMQLVGNDYEKGLKKTTKKHGKSSHKHSHSSSSSSSSESSHERRSTRPSSSRPASSSKIPSSRASSIRPTISSLPPTSTSDRTTQLNTTQSSTSPQIETSTRQACAQSIFPTTSPRNDVGFVYNPDIVFEVFQNESGCDFLKITCSGYFSAFIAAEWTNGREVIFPEPVDAPDNSSLVTTSTTLSWEEYGWGAVTPDLIIRNNSFACMVGSLLSDGKKGDGPSCNCNYETVWLDLMILIDASNSMGDNGLQEIFASIQTTLSWFNVQNTNTTEQFHTRVGIILYNSASTVYAPLGSLTTEQILEIDRVPFLGGTSSRIDYAIYAAMQQFDSAAGRPNARKVIALFASSFNPRFDAGQIRAQSFKEDNGVMFVYNFVQKNGVDTPALASLASKGYFYNTMTDKEGDAFKRSLCSANCYCRIEYSSYKNNEENDTPTAGCYMESDTPANFLFASNRCAQSNKGYLAQGKTLEKTQFLQNQFEEVDRQFYAGIQWNEIEGSYFWMDGSPVNETLPWAAGGQIQGNNCVAIISGFWTPVNCKTGFDYVCESAPCDSTHYCFDEE